MNIKNQSFDVIIIGGSYAGLSAAMALGRSMRDVLIVDSGKPCNRQTPHSHNFITQDGQTPAAISAKAKEQVLSYPTVGFLSGKATAVNGQDNAFKVTVQPDPSAPDQVFQAKKLLFAAGIRDIMPDIPGFASCWGITAIHCPYCHGYEVRGAKTGILAHGEIALEFGRLIKNWTRELTIFTHGESNIDRDALSALDIKVVDKKIKGIVHKGGQLESLEFKDGSFHTLDALYARPKFEQHCDIPGKLGCTLTEEGLIEIDASQKTSVPGIYAAGDNSTLFRAVSIATAAGTKAGAFINHALIHEGF